MTTSRGIRHRHGGQDVPDRRAGDRVRHPGLGDLRRGPGAARLKRECHAVPLWGCCTHRGFLYPKIYPISKVRRPPRRCAAPGRSGVSQLTGPSSKDRGGCSRHKRPWQSGPPPGRTRPPASPPGGTSGSGRPAQSPPPPTG